MVPDSEEKVLQISETVGGQRQGAGQQWALLHG
uniref:Uncharacterized protein n=1 Tax=Parascaris equorum TaxID=6256 RepID=A0A914S7J8_PAREQ